MEALNTNCKPKLVNHLLTHQDILKHRNYKCKHYDQCLGIAIDEIEKYNRKRKINEVIYNQKLRYRLMKLNSQKKTMAIFLMIKKLEIEKKEMLKKYPQMVSFYCGNEM